VCCFDIGTEDHDIIGKFIDVILLKYDQLKEIFALSVIHNSISDV